MLELLVRRPHFFVPRELNALRPVSQLSTYIYIYVCMYVLCFVFNIALGLDGGVPAESHKGHVWALQDMLHCKH